MFHSLKMFNTGQITLPKAWRSKYDTQNFLAHETPHGLLIVPMTAKEIPVSSYENTKESGVFFPAGSDSEEMTSEMKKF